MRKVGLLPVALVLALTVSACKSSEERAEEYYQSGLELAQSGDYDRALVELRNVFEFDGSHREARFLLASIQLEQKNNPRAAYGQLLRLAEQYPDDSETRILLAELAFTANNWEEVERHGEKAVELAPDAPRSEAIAIAMEYRAAAIADDVPARNALASRAQALLSELPDSPILPKLILDKHVLNNEFTQALAVIDGLLEDEPQNLLYWRQRLSLLSQINDMDAIETQLVEMIERFPDDIENKQMLLRFYVTRGQNEEAETFLRDLAAAAAEDDFGPQADLVNFLLQTKGPEAALAQLDTAISTAQTAIPLRSIRAGIAFAQGDRPAAIAELEDILETADPEAEQTLDIKVTLARMLLGTGSEVGARAQVEEVLARDEGHPEALKMQAAWQIREDDADTAINNLRIALDRAPEDVQAMALMAEAYDRTGRPELAQDFLALAADASGNAPVESLRYAQRLIEQERYRTAEDVLIPALRLAPRNIELLATLGTLYIRTEDIPRAEQVIASLRDIDDPQAEQLVVRFETQLIGARDGLEDAIGYLEDVATAADASLANQIELIRVKLATGDAEEALSLSRDIVADNPDNLMMRAVLGSVEAASGNLDGAIEIYRDVVAEEPRAGRVWLDLARAVQRRDGLDASSAVIDEALQAAPEDANLLWASASNKERSGDIDGAIEIYEALYTRNSGSVVVANNLASLLSTYRTDDASLERAWTVARRFRDTDIPAMQDTFGWILHRRGDSAEALPYLEAAAQGLPNDPIVQFHLGEAYTALERPEDALTQYRKAVQIAGPDDARSQITQARETVAAAEAGGTPEN